MRFKYKGREEATIPTASMADIAFLLILFFMVTTVFRVEQGLKVKLPEAEASKKLPPKNVAHVWVSSDGMIMIDDNPMAINLVGPQMERKAATNPNLIVSIQTDKDARYGVVDAVFEQLQIGGALKVNLAAVKERG